MAVCEKEIIKKWAQRKTGGERKDKAERGGKGGAARETKVESVTMGSLL